MSSVIVAIFGFTHGFRRPRSRNFQISFALTAALKRENYCLKFMGKLKLHEKHIHSVVVLLIAAVDHT